MGNASSRTVPVFVASLKRRIDISLTDKKHCGTYLRNIGIPNGQGENIDRPLVDMFL